MSVSTAQRHRSVLFLTALIPLAFAAAAIEPPAAKGMYDPKHGRWLQRDPSGLREGAGLVDRQVYILAKVNPQRQYADGPNLLEYVLSNPGRHVDVSGLGAWSIGDGWPANHSAFVTAEQNRMSHGSDPDAGFVGRYDQAVGILRTSGSVFRMEQSRRMLDHYDGNSGDPMSVDLDLMLREDPEARRHFGLELNGALALVEAERRSLVGTGLKIITADEPAHHTSLYDWDGAIGEYYTRSRGSDIKCSVYTNLPFPFKKTSTHLEMSFEHCLLDNYDWKLDFEESVGFVSMGSVALGHYLGVAQFFTVDACVKYRVEWELGERMPSASAPIVSLGKIMSPNCGVRARLE